MNIQNLSNSQLEQNLLSLVSEEKKVLHLILLHIKEVDSRKLYLKKGRSSLFDYMVTDLGYSSSSAQRRIEGARLIKEIPEVSEKIRDGNLHLSQVGEFVRAIRQKESEAQVKISPAEKLSLISSIECKSREETQKILSSSLDLNLRPIEIKFVQKDESVHMRLTFSKELYSKIQRCQEISSHRLLKENSFDISGVIGVLVDYFLDQKDAKQITVPAQGAVPIEEQYSVPPLEVRDNAARSDAVKARRCAPLSVRSSYQMSSPQSHDKGRPIQKKPMKFTAVAAVKPKLNKTITSKTRRLIKGFYQHCQHVDPNTHSQCRSRFLLEIDHRIPRWAGGTNELSNLSLLCSAHNKAKYRREAGLS